MSKKFILTMTVISAFFAASAEEVRVGELIYKLDVDKKEATVYSTEAVTGAVEILPEVEHEGLTYTVTAIGDHAFGSWMGGRDITSVTIPSTVTTIGEMAFQYTNITSVTIPASVKSIGMQAFAFCNGLTSVSLPGSVETIGPGALRLCENLESAVIGEGIKAIPPYMFERCGKLSSVTLPSTLEEFSDKGTSNIPEGSAFIECTSLTSINLPASVKKIATQTFRNSGLKNITIPDACTEIGAMTFAFCFDLESIKLPENLTVIEGDMFAYCRELKEIIIPDKVTEIGENPTTGCFSGCNSLTKVVLGKSLKVIHQSTFSGCPLEEVTFPESLETIKTHAFDYCTALTEININKNISEIEGGAFANCSKLQAFNVAPENTHFASLDGILYDKPLTTIIAVPAGISGTLELPAGLKAIAERAFYGCYGITSITIPENVESIGNFAFSGCMNLTAINVAPGNSHYSSEQGILYNGDKTELIIMPEDCEITDLTLPATVKTIAASSLSGSRIRTIQLPDGLKTIGDYAFSSAEYLTSVTIPNTVESIGISAFARCRSLTEATLPASLSVIPESVFNDCTSLKSVTLPDDFVEIGNWAFQNTRLESISLPASVTRLGYNALPSQIKTIFIYNPVPPEGGGFIQQSSTKPTAYVPAGSIDAYKSIYTWSNMNLKEMADGNRVLHVKCVAADDMWSGDILYGQFTDRLELNTTYTITMKIRGSKPSTDSSHPILYQSMNYRQTPINVGTEWSTFTIDYTENQVWNALKFRIYIASYDGDLYIDDVVVTKNGDNKNMMVNGNFDILSDEGWDLNSNIGSTMDVVVDEDSQTGIGNIDTDRADENRWRVHTLSGLLIMDTTDRDNLSTLTPGIYIINGKKVLIK